MNLHEPYRFQQPPDAREVAELARIHLRSTFDGALGAAIRAFRRTLAATRREFAKEPSVALLVTLARVSERLREREAALHLVLKDERSTHTVRCGVCHRAAPASVRWVLMHDSGSMFCSGAGSSRSV